MTNMTDPSDNQQPPSKIPAFGLVLLVFIAAIFFCIAVSLRDSLFFSMMFGAFGSGCVSFIVRESVIRFSAPPGFLKKLASYLPIAGYFLACFFCFLYLTQRITLEQEVIKLKGTILDFSKVSDYPEDDGLIADFNSYTDGPHALNAFKLPFFTFSDSQHGMNSTFSYTRVQEDATGGYLEIVYQLQPKDSTRLPYIGLLTDFADPFPVPYDLSKFSAVKLRVKAGQSHSSSPVDVFLILYSGNLRSSRTDRFPRCRIPKQFLTTDWVDFKAPFTDFEEAIALSGERRPLDIKQVYRVGLLITGPTDSVAHGLLYVDELHFVK